MRTVKAVIGSSALVMLMLASSAIGEQSRTHTLRGDFAFTGSTVCVNSGANFATTPPTPPLGFVNLVPIGPSFVNTNSVQGILTFNGDGTGSTVLRFVSLGNPGAGSVIDASNPFTYSVAADGTLTIDNGPSISNTVAGPSAGQQSSVSGVPTFVGRSLVRQEIADVRHTHSGRRDRYPGGARAGSGDDVASLSPQPRRNPDQQRPEIGLAGGRLDRKPPPLARQRSTIIRRAPSRFRRLAGEGRPVSGEFLRVPKHRAAAGLPRTRLWRRGRDSNPR